MRFFYLSILCFLSSSVLFGQIELVPVTSNAVLEAHTAKIGKKLPPQTLQAKVTANDCPEPDAATPLFSEGEPLYIISGESVEVCLDQLSFTELDTVICTTCDDLSYGTVAADPDNYCFTFTSNPGIVLAATQELILEVCDDYGCEDLVFPLIVRRANQTIVDTLRNFQIETTHTICLENIILSGEEKNYSLAGCRDETLASVNLVDNCFEYTSFRFQELDEVCVEVCNEYCVCDTYTFPINISGNTLQLPFFDDFSDDGPYPNPDLWLDDNVYVNNHMGYKPPSIGVATFDGLDETGSPYNGGFGAADVLTSAYIDLEGLSANDNVYLSYYIQPKGNSTFFPGIYDSLTLQFRNDTGVWERIELFDGLSNSTSPLALFPFDNFQIHKITKDAFLHRRFQFRFINHNERSGMQSIWNLDYVRLNSIEIPDGSFEDIALTQEPGSILKTYRHMPWNHFAANPTNELRTDIDVGIFNHINAASSVTTDSWTLVEKTTNLSIIEIELLAAVPFNQKNLQPLLDTVYNNSASFSPIIGLFDQDEEELVFDLTYRINPSVTSTTATRNDTVNTLTNFSNYFAYDDGTPEAIISGSANELQIASQFHSNVADTLVGVQFNFPYTDTDLSADFVIKVWLDDLDQSENPIYTSPPLSTILANQFFDTLNAFSTYPLLSETLEDVKIPLPAGNFFVGIQQVSTSGSIGIGYDLNTPDTTFQFFRAPGILQDWKNIIIPGALMIRPLIGGESPILTSVDKSIENDLSVNIYPNPAQDQIFLPVDSANPEDLELFLVNSTGQVLLQQQWQPELDISRWSNGIYFLQITDKKTGAQVKKKFLILR